jgi:hypothetical protein
MIGVANYDMRDNIVLPDDQKHRTHHINHSHLGRRSCFDNFGARSAALSWNETCLGGLEHACCGRYLKPTEALAQIRRAPIVD